MRFYLLHEKIQIYYLSYIVLKLCCSQNQL